MLFKSKSEKIKLSKNKFLNKNILNKIKNNIKFANYKILFNKVFNYNY